MIAHHLTHGSPQLLCEIGKFLQNVGQKIQTLRIEPYQMREAIEKSAQLLGSTDLRVSDVSSSKKLRLLVGRISIWVPL